MTESRLGRRALVSSVVVTGLCCVASPAAAQSAFVPVTDAMLQDPAPGDWPMWRRTLNGWGYSRLLKNSAKWDRQIDPVVLRCSQH